MLKCLSVALLVAGLAAPASAFVVTDSLTGYSGMQGSSGWSYGYCAPSQGAIDFQPMTVFDGVRWWVDAERYWTMIGPIGAHPNGSITSNGREPVEQWAVRRWLSDFDGPVDLDATLAKLNVAPASNGVIGRIYVDGEQIWSGSIEGTDAVGITPHFSLNISSGTVIDFALDPRASNDYSDNARFSAVISAVPAPGAAGLLVLSGLLAGRRRR